MARILLASPPFSGHLHPTLALGRHLKGRHAVAVVSTYGAVERIATAGLDAIPVLEGADDAVDAIANPPVAVRSNPMLLNRQLRANLALMRDFRDQFEAVCLKWKPDLVIAESILPAAGVVARRLGIPWWTLMTSAPAVYENATSPPSYLGGWMPMRGPLGNARDWLGWRFIQGFKRAIFAYYGPLLRELGFAAIYRPDGSEAVYSDERVIMTHLRELEFATRWPRQVCFVGPMMYSPPIANPVVPPPANPARKRVFLTMGTHVPWAKQRLVAAVEAAARLNPGIDFRCSLGDSSAAPETGGPENLTIVPYAEYEAEIACSDLVVHHAGGGIANECLRQGVPSLVHPVDYDQFDVAARLCAAGVSRRIDPLERLGNAVRDAVDAPDLRARSLAYKAIVAGYGGGLPLIDRMIEERLPAAARATERS
jgi:UDP:flavonoid glycosyltransferase YjiC (YdhE family)